MTFSEGRGAPVQVRFGRYLAGGSSAVVAAALEDVLGDGVALDHDPVGRPVVRGRDDVTVSVTHSASLVVVAVADGRRVGVDCEPSGRGGLHHLPRHVLAERELDALGRLPAEERDGWLLRTWVRKEALSKAVGAGLVLVFRAIELTGPGLPPAALVLPARFGDPGNWSLVDLDLDGHLVVVATEGPAPVVQCAPVAGRQHAAAG